MNDMDKAERVVEYERAMGLDWLAPLNLVGQVPPEGAPLRQWVCSLPWRMCVGAVATARCSRT